MSDQSPPKISEAAEQVVIPPDLTQLQIYLQQLFEEKHNLDLNRDGKLSLYEILHGFIRSPRFVYLLVGMVGSIYGIYKAIIGFFDQEWDAGGIIFSVGLIIAVALLYVMSRNNQENMVKSVREINEYHESKYTTLEQQYQAAKSEAEQAKDEAQAWKTKATLYYYQAKTYFERHPDEKFPNIASLNEEIE